MSSPNPIVITDQDHVFTTSLLVAEKFDKKHYNVLRDIEQIIQNCPDERFRRLNFEVTLRDVPGPKNSIRQEKIYNLTRQGFTMLAMGFTGSKAFLWKITFINAFDRMEQLLSAALANEHQASLHELAVIMNALFDRHPQWKETATYRQQGKSTREIAVLQGKHIRNVQKMIVRMNAAGLDYRPVARLTQQAA